MKIKATNNFSGMVTLSAGEERDVRDDIAEDLIAAGYAAALEPAKKAGGPAKDGGAPDGGAPPAKTGKKK